MHALEAAGGSSGLAPGKAVVVEVERGVVLGYDRRRDMSACEVCIDDGAELFYVWFPDENFGESDGES